MDEAAEAFAAYQQTRFAETLEGQLDAADYLAMSGHWKEAADKFDILSSMNLSKARDIVEKLRSEVNNFRNGAEPNDDLTMLCLKYYFEPEA